jgi:hypothetical protein
VVTIGSYWFCTFHENLLPIVFTDVRPISLFRKSVIGLSLLVERHQYILAMDASAFAA